MRDAEDIRSSDGSAQVSAQAKRVLTTGKRDDGHYPRRHAPDAVQETLLHQDKGCWMHHSEEMQADNDCRDIINKLLAKQLRATRAAPTTVPTSSTISTPSTCFTTLRIASFVPEVLSTSTTTRTPCQTCHRSYMGEYQNYPQTGLCTLSNEDTVDHNDGSQSFDVWYGYRDPSTSEDDTTMDAAAMQIGFTGREETCFLEKRFDSVDTGHGNDPHNCELVTTSSTCTAGDAVYVRSRSEQLRAEMHETDDPVANHDQYMVFTSIVRVRGDREGWQATRCKLDCKDWKDKTLQNGLVQEKGQISNGKIADTANSAGEKVPDVFHDEETNASSFTGAELRATVLDIGENTMMNQRFKVARARSTLEEESLEIDDTEGSECADAPDNLGTRCAVVTELTEVATHVTTLTTPKKDLPRLKESQKTTQEPKMETSILALTDKSECYRKVVDVGSERRG